MFFANKGNIGLKWANKVAVLRPATLLKKRLWHRCFGVDFNVFKFKIKRWVPEDVHAEYANYILGK